MDNPIARNMAADQSTDSLQYLNHQSTLSPMFFPHNTKQSDFFTKTTLPLVKDVLTGQNALLFTYGVTNSGKTYTVQGGEKIGTAGISPRTMDVIFNSIDGLQGDGGVSALQPSRLSGMIFS